MNRSIDSAISYCICVLDGKMIPLSLKYDSLHCVLIWSSLLWYKMALFTHETRRITNKITSFALDEGIANLLYYCGEPTLFPIKGFFCLLSYHHSWHNKIKWNLVLNLLTYIIMNPYQNISQNVTQFVSRISAFMWFWKAFLRVAIISDLLF